MTAPVDGPASARYLATMPLHALTDDERRSYCRREIEALELWLRRLVHETFSVAYGAAYLDATGADGNRLFKSETARQIAARRTADPARYPRPIDTTHLDDLVNVICKPENYRTHFRAALQTAFPEGNEEARTFLDRIVAVRHKLSHATPITAHEAARAICYTQDVIQSLKHHYAKMHAHREYNVPSIINVTDSLGNVCQRMEGDDRIYFNKETYSSLYPEDRLTIEVEVDPTFDRASYQLKWSLEADHKRVFGDTNRITINIDSSHVHEQFLVYCKIVTDRNWHRYGNKDDFIMIAYKVLPPAL